MRYPRCPVAWAAIVLLLPIALAAAEPEATPGAEPAAEPGHDRRSLDWIRKEKVRAMYLHRWSSEDLPGKLTKAGFNTLHVQFVDGQNLTVELLEQWAGLARKENLRLFTSTWWSYPSKRETRDGTDCGIGTRYRGFVNAAGRLYTMTVCPVDKQYWQDWIAPGLLVAASHARKGGITGMTIDTEQYGTVEPDGSRAGFYYFAGMCFCDHCFADFGKMLGTGPVPGDVPAKGRGKWLKQHGYLKAYEARLKANVQAMARSLERRVHAIDPDVLLGFMNYYGRGGYFFNGLRDGFKTPDRPVIIWTETPTYNIGYFPHVDEQYEMFRRIGDVVYVPGLFLEAHIARHLRTHAHNLAMHSDGYWVFTRRKMDLLVNPYILGEFKGGNERIAKAAPAGDEAPFLDLWKEYDSVMALPKQWRFRLDPGNKGRQEAWYAVDYDMADWTTMRIGEFWDRQLGRLYEGTAWYRLALDVPAAAAGRKLFLAFVGVDEKAWVWVNGRLAGKHSEAPVGVSHRGRATVWNNRFLIDVTEQLKPGRTNHIAVRVFNSFAAGGIWRPVRLIAKKAVKTVSR